MRGKREDLEDKGHHRQTRFMSDMFSGLDLDKSCYKIADSSSSRRLHAACYAFTFRSVAHQSPQRSQPPLSSPSAQPPTAPCALSLITLLHHGRRRRVHNQRPRPARGGEHTGSPLGVQRQRVKQERRRRRQRRRRRREHTISVPRRGRVQVRADRGEDAGEPTEGVRVLEEERELPPKRRGVPVAAVGGRGL